MSLYPEYSYLYLAVAAAAAIAISILFYRSTKLKAVQKTALVSLRAAVIFLVCLLIFISYVSYKSENQEKPLNIFLADISGSMTLENRSAETKEVFELFRAYGNDFSENKFYLFANGIIAEAGSFDSVKSGGITNLSKAIGQIIKINGGKKISSINVITDGLINEGGNPLQTVMQAGAKFSYYLAGDTVQKKDLSVRNVYFNKTTFTGSLNKITMEFASYEIEKEIKISLYEDDIKVQEKLVKVSKDKSLYGTEFEIKSGNEGIKKYRTEIENVPGEITYKNNSEEFFINYLSNKFRILVISGSPSPDYSYLKEAVLSSENFQADFFTEKSAGVFYEGNVPSLDGYDILLLADYPGFKSDLVLSGRLKTELSRTGLPLFFIAGSSTDYEKIKIFSDYLPFTVAGSGKSEEKSAIKFLNGVSNNGESFSGLEKSVLNSGEIFLPGADLVPRPGAETILISGKSNRPVLIINKSSQINSAAFTGYGYFKWRLNSSGADKRDLMGSIISKVISGIGDKEKSKKIKLETDRQVYGPDETIRMSGTINSLKANGMESVKFIIYNSNYSKESDADKSSSDNFNTNFRDIPEGEYFVKAVLIENGAETAADTKKIIVKEQGAEYKDTKSDNNITEYISRTTGGRRIYKDDIKEAFKQVSEKNKQDLSGKEQLSKNFLNSSIPLLIVIIMLFSAEWFFRKRMNLP